MRAFCNKRVRAENSKRRDGDTKHRFARSLHVAHSFAAVRRCSFRIDRNRQRCDARASEGNTRCQLSRHSHRILRDTSPREDDDDYVHGSTRRFYTFPLHQPLTSPRMHRVHRSTIDKRPRKATQFNRRRCDSLRLERLAEEREREKDAAMCVTGKTYEQEMDGKSTFES